MNDDMKDQDDLIAALRDLKSPAPSAALMARIDGDAAALSALDAGRRTPPVPSEMLMARIARDAARQRPRRWQSPAGWAALVAAGVAGLAIGLADPVGMTASVWPDGDTLAMSTLVPAYDFQYLDLE
ncbi:hypothetical protein [Roseovarius sp. Pro17]|uniref:hypothetical protein n=1 Tax=Roseovarius sp. Pro17 TaxID=3108175 RepID=UPI002D77E4D4|nr:hypothetical protein [Roseovarius sp. Pro17]